MITVKIDEDTILELLRERLTQWTQNEDAIDLYMKMYESYVYGGCFDGMEFDVDVIVDNDYVNYCSVVEEGEDDFNDLLKVYKAQGLGDCSCEDCNANFIEAISDDEKMILIRW